jgi:uncharacterized membrane protein YgcG
MKEEHLIVHASMDLTIPVYDGYFIYGVVHRLNQDQGEKVGGGGKGGGRRKKGGGGGGKQDGGNW